MASNTLGEIIRITSFGESHGMGVGVVIDGFPAGVDMPYDLINKRLQERKPGSSEFVSPRKEDDNFEILSGVFQNKTTGSPITLFIKNTNQNPKDYDALKEVYRPSHADYSYQQKYGIRDHRGGGRSSARVTAAWVAAGALAESLLIQQNIEVISYVKQIYTHSIPSNLSIEELRNSQNPIRCPHLETRKNIEKEIANAILEKDSLGGIIATQVLNCPIGLGDPVFGKFQVKLSQAIFSLNAVKGLQFGGGFEMCSKKGSQVNDEWEQINGTLQTKTNFSGGLQGGISNGMPIYFEVALKPTATIGKQQNTVNTEGNETILNATGRHDPCVVPRAVPIVQALTHLVLLDLFLLNKNATL